MAGLKTIGGRLNSLPKRVGAPASVDEADRSRSRDQDQTWRKWYKTARWQKLRLECLRRDAFICQQTGVALVGKYPAQNSPVADHVKPHRGDEGLFFDLDNLQAVSKSYHDKEKQRIERNS